MQTNPKALLAYFRMALLEKFPAARWPDPILGRGNLANHPRKSWLLACLLFLTAALVALISFGQSSPPNIPAITLATEPLFAANGDKPAITLALSVEFPTVGAQYTAAADAATDNAYTNTKEYLGYYDAESCYTYNNTPTETPQAGESSSDYKRFDRTGAATQRKCEDAFSGNFLNWASSSAVDMFRLALSGGDRSIDREDLTILQRAYISNGDPYCTWNTTTFPAKQLLRNGGNPGTYWGAVPIAMRTAAGTNDIWIGNALNRIFFGTARSGACGSTDTLAYTLGTAADSPELGTVELRNQALPSDASPVCAAGGDVCVVSGTGEVWFGAGTRWAVAPATGPIACGGIGSPFGDPAPGVYKFCYTRSYSGTWSPSRPPKAVLNTDGFFYSRVKVCEQDSTGALIDVRTYDFCTRYPNGKYKPTGTIQKYADSLRLAAFGYALEQTSSASGGRYGGVLRAPMKYVGNKTFNEYGQDNTPAGGNPASEWDKTTGIFKANPDGDTTQTPGISGVVNYLNKFGRTGKPGRYKIYDPVSELHYEALRYLQGLPPSLAAVSNLTTQMYDGFPIYTDWSSYDPYANRPAEADYSCLKSSIVILGDIVSNDSYGYTRFPGFNPAGNVPNFPEWFNTVAAFERGAAVKYPDGEGKERETSNPNAPNPDALNLGKFAIVGPAYWANTHDIRGTGWTDFRDKQRPGLRVKTFAFDVNQFGSGNVAANRRNRNQFFTAAKYGGFETKANAGTADKPYNSRGNPFFNSKGAPDNQNGVPDNDVWQDPANPGEPNSFYIQSDARAILSAFDRIFLMASTQARSIAGSATSSKNITQSGSTIYQAGFDTSDWNGDLLSLPLNVDSSNVASIGSTANWSAADKLSTLAMPAASRNIVVGKAGATANPVASSFTWDAIDSTLQAHLAKITPNASADSLAQDRLNYLRGDKSKEGISFRKRTKLLGDIVNSGIVYSGAPAANVGPSSTYAGFVAANASRAAAVFVGANDGMLHAFNASTGNELFGYIPSWMGPKLAALTSKDYNNNHQSYVDATPTVAEAQVGSAGESSDWKTVLVSGTGAGGAGVFALDVTNPSAFSASNVMWEFTHADDADLGYVVGRPRIVKLRTSAPNAITPTYRWFAMVASGVNNYVPDAAFGGIYSSAGKPALFLLALDKPAGAAWTAEGASPNYYKISLPIDTAISTAKATGLINFQPVFGTAAEVTQVYMGDLHGNLWKLDFSRRGSTEWNMNKLSAYNKGTIASPQPYPLYIAKTGGSAPVRQPISMAPSVVAGPLVGGVRTIQIAFATGKYLETSDNTATGSNSLYVIYDNGSTAADSSPAADSVISSRSRLQSGNINSTTGAVTVPAFTWGRAASDTDATQRSGWMLDFTGEGERVVNSATVAGDNLIFGSLIPVASKPCVQAGGGGKSYVVNVDSGQGSAAISTVGLLGEPLVLEITSAATYSNSTTTGRRAKTVVQQIVQQGSSGVTASGTVTNTLATGRLSWRQINNYQDLKNAP